MPKSFHKICFFVLIFLLCEESFGQEYLVFDKPGLVKRVRFYPGDFLIFKTSQSDNYVRDQIISFEGQNVFFQNTASIYVDSIRFIRAGNYSSFSKVRAVISNVLITAGIGYLIIDSFNNGINNDDIFDRKSLNTSVILVITGVLIKPWKNRRHKIGNNKRLYVIDMDKGLE